MTSEGFPARLRLRRRRDFLRVQRSGSKQHTRHYLVLVAPNETMDHPRFGITVTRKVGHAVARNRIKRLTREALRRSWAAFAPGHDFVFVAKQNARNLTFDGALWEVGQIATRTKGGGGG